ncbi:MAG TPA: M20 peptidase family dipeptidase, partial [Burkholderiales bacterium]|nr:M20 peptidase family dipeptidase [Burkholderiales bacterium]
MTRQSAIAAAQEYFDSGAFAADLARRVAIPTESQNPERLPELERYLRSEIASQLERLRARSR